jgi:hypothetical protein
MVVDADVALIHQDFRRASVVISRQLSERVVRRSASNRRTTRS